jgi:asparagine synthase (glutamine-hydrolysing)
MCGITGTWSGSLSTASLDDVCRRMTDRLLHRGPDDGGIWVDPAAPLALGHRRLSILDLSGAGRQPMASACGRWVMVFNGEIYNHRALREVLDRSEQGGGYPWRGHSDTEVLLARITRMGVLPALPALRGMFAFAVWDRAERALWLVRDRLGVKPLYAARVDSTFIFASDPGALLAHPALPAVLNRRAAARMLAMSCLDHRASILEHVRQVAPGGWMRWCPADAEPLREGVWWHAESILPPPGAPAPMTDEGALVRQVHAALRESIALRMVSDVPVGGLLSGGIDSSTVVALMQAESRRPVHTFTIGWTEPAWDESADARRVADHLGTRHHEQRVHPEDALHLLPSLAHMFSEPFGDASQVPTLLVSALARQTVKVVLSGDGGDELFAGYNRHVWGPRVLHALRSWPLAARRLAARTLLHPSMLEGLGQAHGLGRRMHLPLPDMRRPAARLSRLARVLDAPDAAALYARLVRTRPDAETLILGQPVQPWNRRAPERLDPRAMMQFEDLVGYLPDDILTKVDRASMYHGLEAREPLLDDQLLQLAFHLPDNLRVRAGQSKWVLRRILHQYVPPALVERPKIGFGIPIGPWLRGPLWEWAEGLLHPDRLEAGRLFDRAGVRRLWSAHQRGEDHTDILWNVLMLQSWMDVYQPRIPEPEAA